jgi:hypothetical protein
MDVEKLRRVALVDLVAAALAMSGCSSGGRPAPAGIGSPRQHTRDGIGTRVDVTGRLEGVGGPAPGAPRPWPGTVTWRGPTAGTVHVATDGRFLLSLPPGRYQVTGHSPRYGDGRYLCRATRPLVVGAGPPVHLDVLCHMK